MNTKPKVRKFRIRRAGPLTEGGPALEQDDGPLPETGQATDGLGALFDNHDDGFGERPFPTARNANISNPAEVAGEQDIDAIRREGLTGRQLRMARRVAQKNGLAPTSDFDAVRLLRAQGIDPFERSAMLELVASSPIEDEGGDPAPQLPSTVVKPRLPSTEVMSEDTRAREIFKIQQDIARRRRRKLALLFTRLAFFVLLPTLIAGYYYFQVASPLYATRSEFVIQKADVGTGGASLAGLFSGSALATSQDSITVQSYMQSREAMLRLDSEVGFKSVFSQPGLDPITRLPANATNEDAYRLYKRMVRIGYDPTEGIVKMEVIAPDPQVSARYSTALIKYAEEQVDALTKRMRDDQMAGARQSYDDAEAKMEAAQQKVLDLQEQMGVLDPASEQGVLMGQISGFETQLANKKLSLQQLLDNSQPNQARVDGLRGDIQRLEALIADLRGQLTGTGNTTASLARITSELHMAEVDLQTRQLMTQQALQQLETARIEANRQVRYLSLGVSPVAPDAATYPRRFESTVLAFLIFSGIYLMFSLTASILREQVSA